MAVNAMIWPRNITAATPRVAAYVRVKSKCATTRSSVLPYGTFESMRPLFRIYGRTEMQSSCVSFIVDNQAYATWIHKLPSRSKPLSLKGKLRDQTRRGGGRQLPTSKDPGQRLFRSSTACIAFFGWGCNAACVPDTVKSTGNGRLVGRRD